MSDNLKIPYGISSFTRLRGEGYYYIDKTSYINTLELCGSFLFFVRPRRFGKSLFISMLESYYDVAEKDRFLELFGDLDIGRNPTENANRYQVLSMDFSKVNTCDGDTLQARFANYVNTCLAGFLGKYESLYGNEFWRVNPDAKEKGLFTAITTFAKNKGYHLYLFIDEYDNFTNAMLRAEGNVSYEAITHGQGFYREWFKGFKGSFDRIFMTGVSPVTMDDLTSGFNIASNISQATACNAMIGFSEAEVLKMYTDFKGTAFYADGAPADWVRDIKPWYDGYCFAEEKRGKESVFNSDMSLYFLQALVKTGEPPKNWVGRNQPSEELLQLKNCERFIRETYSSELMSVSSVLQAALSENDIDLPVLSQFDFEAIDDQKTFLSLFYYYGILTLKRYHHGQHYYGFPNEWWRCQAQVVVEL